ncbi:hypothetical protein MMC08_000076 [Hypocenomyce scalaris]|nr:hypothetical protein [Hypocenomyce scalaris]
MSNRPDVQSQSALATGPIQGGPGPGYGPGPDYGPGPGKGPAPGPPAPGGYQYK